MKNVDRVLADGTAMRWLLHRLPSRPQVLAVPLSTGERVRVEVGPMHKVAGRLVKVR